MVSAMVSSQTLTSIPSGTLHTNHFRPMNLPKKHRTKTRSFPGLEGLQWFPLRLSQASPPEPSQGNHFRPIKPSKNERKKSTIQNLQDPNPQNQNSKIQGDRGQLRPYPRVSCDPTRARGQLRPYPQEFYGRVNVFYLYQGSAATLPDLSVKNPTGFCSVSRSSRFKYSIPSINYSPPFGNTCFQWLIFPLSWQPMLSMIQVQEQHSFATLPDNIPFIKFPPPLGNPCFQWFKFKYNIPFINFFPPPLATHALRPYLTTFLLSNFPPPWQPMLSMIRVQVQHPFYQFFSPPPWQPMLCDPTWQHSFYQIFPPPPLATHAFNDSSSSTAFLLSIFPPPPLGNPCFATLPDNIPPPLATHAFNDSSSSTTFLLSKIFPPPWQPMLCDPTWQHSFYQIFHPPLGNPFSSSSSSTTFLLSKISPPPPWQPMLSMIQVPVQHSFYQIFPPPPLGNPCFATQHTWQHSLYQIFPPPPWQPMLSMIQVQVQHSFLSFFPPPPLGNPCNDSSSSTTFLFIIFSPPLGNPCFATLPDNIPFIKFSPPWQPMLSMIQVQVQHSFYQFFPPPPLATHALRPYLTTFLLSNFPPPWQPILSMIQVQVQHSFYEKISPPLAKNSQKPLNATQNTRHTLRRPHPTILSINNAEQR